MKATRLTTSPNGRQGATLLLAEDWQVTAPARGKQYGELTIAWADVGLRAGLLVAASVGWLGLVLAQAGRFTPLNLAALTGLGAAIAMGTWFARHQRLPRLPMPTRHDVVLVGLLILAAILYTPPADYALTILDAGWYTNTGALIARTGRLTVQPEVFATLSREGRSLFVWSFRDVRRILPQFPALSDLGFYNVAFAVNLAQDGRVGPYHPPGFAVWIAIFDVLGGPRLGTYAAPLFGLLFVLAVYGAARVAFGPRTGLVAAFLTAISPPVVYYGRTPFAEIAAGALIWGGVYALTRYRHHGTPFDAALAGLAFGAALLTKIESLLLLAPLTYLLITQPPSHSAIQPFFFQRLRLLIPFLIPFGMLAAHAALLAATVLRPYTVLNGYGVITGLSAIVARPVTWLMVAVLAVTGIVLLRSQQRNWVRKALALGVIAGAAIVILFRPRVADLPFALSEVMLFLTPLGIGLAVLGAVRLIHTGLPRSATVFVVMAATMGLLTLATPMVSRDVSYLYAVRRQVPVVIPAVWVLAAYAVTENGKWKTEDRKWKMDDKPSSIFRFPSSIFHLALLLVLALGLMRTNRYLPVRELAGSSAFAAGLAGRFGPEDIVLFEALGRGTHVGRFAAPLWARHGVQALVLSAAPPPTERLATVIEGWSGAGRTVFLISQSSPPNFDLLGYRWEPVGSGEWIGSMVAARRRFPPESQTLRVPFYIYEVIRYPTRP